MSHKDYMPVTDGVLHILLEEALSGGLRKFSNEHNIDPGDVSKIRNHKRPMSKSLAKILGYKPVTMYERIE